MYTVNPGWVAALVATAVFSLSCRLVRAGVPIDSRTSDDAAPTWQIEGITGTYGSAGDEGTGGSATGGDPAYVERRYGAQVTQGGNACSGSWPETTRENRLRVRLKFVDVPAEGAQVSVSGTARLDGKETHKLTVDWECPAIEPRWSSTTDIRLFTPAANGHGNGTAQAGAPVQSLGHAPSQGTTDQEDTTSANGGSNHANQSNAMGGHTWNVVRGDASTHAVTITAKCVVKFRVDTAMEITVVRADTHANARLEVSAQIAQWG